MPNLSSIFHESTNIEKEGGSIINERRTGDNARGKVIVCALEAEDQVQEMNETGLTHGFLHDVFSFFFSDSVARNKRREAKNGKSE